MYRHLLVPVDDSSLATHLVRKGVELARALGAKVTFFHAQEEYGATSVAALERVLAPMAFNEHIAGEARAILAKAEVVAREMGVLYDSLAVTSNRPYEAILQAAEARGCDLIFIASHGRRGVKGILQDPRAVGFRHQERASIRAPAARSVAKLPRWHSGRHDLAGLQVVYPNLAPRWSICERGNKRFRRMKS